MSSAVPCVAVPAVVSVSFYHSACGMHGRVMSYAESSIYCQWCERESAQQSQGEAELLLLLLLLFCVEVCPSMEF